MTLSAYQISAEKYVPLSIKILFIAESPPSDLERYFYFENLQTSDWLWIGLMKAIYGVEFGVTKKERLRRKQWLVRFRNDGYRLIDASKEPFCKGVSPRKREKLCDTVSMRLLRRLKIFHRSRFC